MDEITMTANHVPTNKDKEDLKRFAKTQGLKRVVIRVGEDEFVIEPEVKDAEGRVLLSE